MDRIIENHDEHGNDDRNGFISIPQPLTPIPQSGGTTMQHAFLTVDLGFGDAGKGSIVDFLSREHLAHTVVRYNGGAQAAHRVVAAGTKPREHVFAQFGSGTLAGAATHLSRFMLLDPLAMLAEEQHLQL